MRTNEDNKYIPNQNNKHNKTSKAIGKPRKLHHMTAGNTLSNKIILVEWKLDDMVVHICYTFLGAVHDQLGRDKRWMHILALATACMCKSCFLIVEFLWLSCFCSFDEFGDVCVFV